jgi:hypothetical protein
MMKINGKGCGPKTAHDWYLKGYRTPKQVLENEKHLNRIQEIALRHFDDLSLK